MPAPPGPTPSGPAPQNDLQEYLILIAMAITGGVIVAVVMITREKKDLLVAKHTQKTFPARGGPLPETGLSRRIKNDMFRDVR